MRPTAAVEHTTKICPRQRWAGTTTDTSIEIVGPDLSRDGRWIVLLHSVDLTASFDDDDIRGHYQLVRRSGPGARRTAIRS